MGGYRWGSSNLMQFNKSLKSIDPKLCVAFKAGHFEKEKKVFSNICFSS